MHLMQHVLLFMGEIGQECAERMMNQRQLLTRELDRSHEQRLPAPSGEDLDFSPGPGARNPHSPGVDAAQRGPWRRIVATPARSNASLRSPGPECPGLPKAPAMARPTDAR